MREIKFRAWDKMKNEMLYGIEGTTDNIWDRGGNPLDYGEECFGVFLCYERYSVMQYTGLKDKNGKEIYEGDIVQSTESIARGYVCWRKNASFGVWNDRWDRFALSMDEWEWEVIGNIYENPELLKEVTK